MIRQTSEELKAKMGWLAYLIGIARALRGEPNPGDQAEVMRGRQVLVSTDRSMPVEFDGEAAGEANGMTVRVLPAAIVICSGGRDA
jgi:diacylglycerol kinase family enzyme